MRRFTTGTTDQYIYFVAVDSTDLKTRETGLSSFTVYRARNGGSATAYTTPTIAEVSSANMPGVYSLLLDEDMTIGSGNDSEEVVLHITQASMAPVTLVYELYRRAVSDGQTLTVSSGNGNAAVQSVATGAITAGAIAADAIGASELATDAVTEITNAVWAAAARTLTANTNLNDLNAAGIRAAVGLASANLDTQIGTLATASSLSTVAGYIDTEVAAIKAKTDNLPSDPADASDIAAAFGTVNSTLSTIAGYIDTEVGAIKAKTDSLTFTVTGQVDANVASVNSVAVGGAGTEGSPWGPA